MSFVKNAKQLVEIHNNNIFKGSFLWAYNIALELIASNKEVHPIYRFNELLSHEVAKMLFLEYYNIFDKL